MTGYWFGVALFALCIYFMWVGERREEERQDALRIAELEWMARDAFFDRAG